MNPSPVSPSSSSPIPRRPRRSAAFWQDALDRHAASGLSIPAFAREHGLAASSLYHWRRRLNRAAEPLPAPRVLRIEADDDTLLRASATTVTAQLPNGVTLTADPVCLPAFVRALAAC